ncbi:MAG: hypothetical protein SCAL_001013 [Candidatus Syntrophoarchaeum caldarius]|uniref:Uncharacterized protein n=1 Tax=Candidatus Syntropharchaeum caldarium TaxID=1838285 RepID=A0A1F2P8R3_9EURY|nr:MAG: hypothetical protein SCAL_001013 [Candidatus Syntrophoarchaeum caldarius]
MVEAGTGRHPHLHPDQAVGMRPRRQVLEQSRRLSRRRQNHRTSRLRVR